MKVTLNSGRWSWIINTCCWVWLSFKFQNFTALSVRKLMRIFHWSIQMKFCKINLSEKSFQAILQCSEEKFSLTITLWVKFKIENCSPILSFELEFRSLLYPLLILFVGRLKVSSCNYEASYLGINFTIYKNLRNRSRWMAVLVSRPFALWALRTNLQTFYSSFDLQQWRAQ